jgi:plasmid maintenance system antidote protein VapI
MATSVTQSLFGITPQSIQNERDAALQQQAIQFAKLDPFQAARMGLFQGAAQLGSGIVGALGDPEIEQARQRQGMLGGLDLNDPDALMAAAQNIQGSDPQAALALFNQANAVKKDLSTVNKNKYEMEQDQAAYQMRFTGLKSRYPEMDDEQVRSLASDVEAFRKAMEGNKVFQETAEGVFLVDKNNPANKVRIGTPVDKRSVTKVDIGAPDTTGKAFEVADADSLKNLRTAAAAAAGQLGFISQARDQVQNLAVAGTGVPSVVRGINTFLAPLGINSDQVAKTRNLEQALNSIIAQGIKQYGANPSTADLEFAKRASASITDPQQAIAETLNYLEERAQALINKSTAADTYLLQNKNLGGFEQFWVNQQRNANNPPQQSGVRKTKSGVSYTVVPQN